MRKIHFKNAEGKVVKWKDKIGIVRDIQIVNRNVTGRLIEIPSNQCIWIKIRPEDDNMVTLLSKIDTLKLHKNIDYQSMLNSIYLTGGFLMGADPEVFVVNKQGIIIPAFTFLPHKKAGNPFWDGFQAEFTTRAYNCLAFLVDEVQSKLKTILNEAKKIDETASLTYKSVVEIPISIMNKADKEHVMLGCAPSKNIYNIPSIKIDDPYTLPIRFAGCHFHLGGDRFTNIDQTVGGIDAILGVISVSLFQGMEDERRRRYYGRAGEFRTPTHGLEYRTLSSAVLSHPVLFHLCYDLARASAHIAQAQLFDFWNTKDFSIPDIINDYDIIAAKKLLIQNKAALMAILEKLYRLKSPITTKLYNLIIEGAINMLPVNDMADNWHIKRNQIWKSHSEGNNCCVYKLNIEEV